MQERDRNFYSLSLSYFKISIISSYAVNKQNDQNKRNTYHGNSANQNCKKYHQTAVTASAARPRSRGFIRIIFIQIGHIIPSLKCGKAARSLLPQVQILRSSRNSAFDFNTVSFQFSPPFTSAASRIISHSSLFMTN